jgi:predicted PurR-regulated permease PerM
VEGYPQRLEADVTEEEQAPQHQPAEVSEAPPTVRAQLAQPVVVPRWIQLVLLPLGVLGLWALVQAAGPVIVIFLIAAVIALILNPIVRLLTMRAHFPRGLAVATVYLGFFVAAAAIVFALANPVSDQVTAFQRDVPGLVDDANAGLADFQGWLDDRGIKVHITDEGSTALETLQTNVLQGSGDVVTFTRDVVQRVVEGTIALVLILVLSIYMLLYGDRIGELVRHIMPPGDGTPEDDYPLRIQKAVSGYVRGQLLFSLIMGTSAGAALWIFGAVGIFPDGKTYALFFGIFFGLMELVPYVGPVLGAIPPILVALFQDPLTAVWVVILFVALQQLEGHVVAPVLFSQALRINPLLIIFALALGAQLYGIIGALLALPIAAIARETVAYLRGHLVFEPWGTPSAAAIAAERSPTPPEPQGGDDLEPKVTARHQ